MNSTITVPELAAYLVDGESGLRVWCAWCLSWHYHGPGYGHRVAHCANSRSPYRQSGYLLVKPDINQE